MTARDRDMRALLRDAPVPDALAARERGWAVVHGAFAGREPLPRRRAPRTLAAALALVLLAAIVVAGALTPPGEAVENWLGDVVRRSSPAPRHVRPLLGPLPGHGRLLVLARTGAWIVRRDGTHRRLGAYDDATFSPHGLFEAVARGRLLAAVDPRGSVRWTLTRRRRITRPAWSPDGFRVAYRSGPELRVVYGDGTLNRRLARRSAPVTPAWRPGAAHRLAWVDGRGRIVLADTDTRRVLWHVRAGDSARQLAWSPDGRRLLVVTPSTVRLLTPAGDTARLVRMPPDSRAARAAWLPGHRGFALLRADTGGLHGEAVVLGPGHRRPRRLFAIAGRLSGLLPSPNGRWLLLGAPDAGQWLLVATSSRGQLTALSGVPRQFDPGGRRPAQLPRLVGWIR